MHFPLFRSILSTIMSVITFIEISIGTPLTGLFFKIDIPASVFETGNDMYTVMWTTNKRGTGSVCYTYKGKEYVVYDQDGGNIRCTDTIHSVRVPKEHLDNNTYTVSSQYVSYKGGYQAVKGKTVSSKPVVLTGYHNQKSVITLVLSDIHENLKPAKKAASSFSVSPDFIILNGDIVSTMEEKEKFTWILDYSYQLSEGKIPVVYARGNHEPRGEYASEMMRYFRTETGNLYFTFKYGPVWSVVLDSGEDKADDHKEYSGLVDFTTYIAQETEWLDSLKSDTSENTLYRMGISHNPVFENEYGNNWTVSLEKLNLDVFISGHWHELNLSFREGSTSFPRLITGGKSDDGFIATMMTFSDGMIFVSSKNQKGSDMGERIIKV